MYADAAQAHETYFLGAVCSGSAAAVDRFLAAGIKHLHEGSAYFQALKAAILSHHPIIATNLIEDYQADIQGIDSLGLAAYLDRAYDGGVLKIAALSGELELVKLVWNIEPPRSERVPSQFYGQLCWEGTSPGNNTREFYLLSGLHSACSAGAFHIVSFLLDKGPDIHLADPVLGNTALHWACYGGSLPIVSLLLAAEANHTRRNMHAATPVLLAVQDLPVLEALVKAGADLTVRDAENHGLLFACFSDFAPIPNILYLLDQGLDASELLEDDLVASCLLHQAATTDTKSEYVALLLQLGVKALLIKDEYGRTPIEAAMRTWQVDSVRSLLKALEQLKEKSPEAIAEQEKARAWLLK